MTLRLSTKMRNAMLGDAQALVRSMIVANTISFDNASGEIRDSGNGFVTAGFLVGDVVKVDGTVSNDGSYTITSVAAGVLVTSEGVATEAAGTIFGVAAAQGGSLKDILENGILRIYSGSQPATADTAYAGTELFAITIASGAWVAGAEANGLEFGVAASGELEKAAGVWSGVGLADGTAGWWRFYANATDAGGASTTLPRIDGSVGTSGADLNMSSTTIVTAATYTIDTFKFTLPLQYGA